MSKATLLSSGGTGISVQLSEPKDCHGLTTQR